MKRSQTPQAQPRSLVPLAKNMVAGAFGPLMGFIVLFALPLFGARLLPTDQFALWSVLSSISTISLSLDFGGVALTMARFHHEPRIKLLARACALSCSGSALIGLIAGIAWIPYSTTTAAQGFSFVEGLAAIGVTTLASCLRSVLMVLGQAALNESHYRLRNIITAGQALVAFIVTISWALVSPTAWALPAGWFISSLLILLVAVPYGIRLGLFRQPAGGSSPIAQLSSVTTFAASRTVATIVGALLLQSDRWIIGALAGPEFLAAYEVAWRLASMPKFLIQNLSVATGSNAAALRDTFPDRVLPLLRHTTLLAGFAGVVSAIVFGAIYGVAADYVGVSALPVVFLAMLVAYTLHGLTSPLSFVGISVGIPAIDIPYLLLTAGLSIVSIAIAASVQVSDVYVFGNLGALAVGVGWFFLYGPNRIRRYVVGTRSTTALV